MHYIRTGMFPVNALQVTSLRLITSSITIKPPPVPLETSQKTVVGLKKQQVAKQNKIIKTLWPLFMDGVQLLQG